ncbi:hypothetical protein CEE37_01145 [candidate division LCP-89 bacterium B3_LCP]|uniref:Tachylectin 2 domain-containing protein n=1 Tax=candidate division LCP-89 bacterium B3_LCP TaxID=2012998 RepID=A0A532V544_UNCL8|nr:MAG: hypothetical protein CEE37_01145 [candidate division LCP-89 bacterium B3_LCP]
MRFKIFLLLIPLFLLTLTAPTHAWWFEYNTPEENLPIAVDENIWESDPIALPSGNGSTLVVFYNGEVGICYQLIDRYGELVFPEPQSIVTGPDDSDRYYPKAISDGDGGAFVAWRVYFTSPNQGYYIQHLDSLGNRVWDEGIQLTDWEESDFTLNVDGQGGLYFAAKYTGPGSNGSDIWAQRIDADGQFMWGDSGRFILCLPYNERYPEITHDGNGGLYIVWEDWRSPYTTAGALFMQRFDEYSFQVWPDPAGIFIYEGAWYHDVIPDGEGGFILHTGSATYGYAFRIGSDGTTLWSRDHVSWGSGYQEIVPGEPGYFYLGYSWGPMYAQRMDVDGNFYWPDWSIGQYGALMGELDNFDHGSYPDWAYKYPYFFAGCPTACCGIISLTCPPMSF